MPFLQMPDELKEETDNADKDAPGKKTPAHAPDNVFGICGGINFGPNCNGRCKHCFQRHLWFCHGCCCVQYCTYQPWVSQEGTAGRQNYKEVNEAFMEPCINGCDWRKMGWTCIASGSPGEEAGCLSKLPAQHWREHGCTRPVPLEGNAELRVENLTLKEFTTICERQAAVTWERLLPPTAAMLARIDDLTTKYNVHSTGNWNCKLGRINWRAMQKGEPDGLTCRPVVHPVDEVTEFDERMPAP